MAGNLQFGIAHETILSSCLTVTSTDRPAFVARKKALIDAGVTQAQIARVAGVTSALVHQVLKGNRKSPRVMAALNDWIGGELVLLLWPANGKAPQSETL